MTCSALKAPGAVLLLSFATSVLAQTIGAHTDRPQEAALSCPQMIDRVSSTLSKMPAGVEKMSAQKELASAKMALDKGDMARCKVHAHNALTAMTDKSAR